MKYNAIIFDMDGTIIDTEPLWQKASRKLLADRGIILQGDDELYFYERLKGIGLPRSCELIKEITKSDEKVCDLIQEKISVVHALYDQGVQFVQGFPEFHAITLSLQLKTALATNAMPQTVLLTNRILNLEQFFGKHVYSIAHVNNIGKPDPAIYLYAAQQLRIDPKTCIAIEDSAHGIKAAQAAGMFCIGINTSKNMEQVKQAHLIINEYKDLNIETIL